MLNSSQVGWARFLCPRGIRAIASKLWAEKHCPPCILNVANGSGTINPFPIFS